MSKKRTIFLLVFLILLSSIVVAPPQIAGGDNNLQIKFPGGAGVMLNQPFDAHFHIFSQETGLPLTNADIINCTFHLYNQTNNHIARLYYDETDFENTYDIEVSLDANNFTSPGVYNFIFQCWCDSCSVVVGYDDLGGFVSNNFIVAENIDFIDNPFFTNGINGLFFFLGVVIFIISFLMYYMESSLKLVLLLLLGLALLVGLHFVLMMLELNNLIPFANIMNVIMNVSYILYFCLFLYVLYTFLLALKIKSTPPPDMGSPLKIAKHNRKIRKRKYGN